MEILGPLLTSPSFDPRSEGNISSAPPLPLPLPPSATTAVPAGHESRQACEMQMFDNHEDISDPGPPPLTGYGHDPLEELQAAAFQDYVATVPAIERSVLEEEAATPLWVVSQAETSHHSRLSGALALLHIQDRYKITDSGMTAIFNLLSSSMLPSTNTLPVSHAEVRRLLVKGSDGLQRIDACAQDCCLFRGNYVDAETCPVCG